MLALRRSTLHALCKILLPASGGRVTAHTSAPPLVTFHELEAGTMEQGVARLDF